MTYIPYNLSTDYEKLFELIEDNQEIAGYVPHGSIRSGYQLVTCEKFEHHHYILCYPGHSFAQLLPFDFKNTTLTEKELFIKMVSHVNFSFIVPE